MLFLADRGVPWQEIKRWSSARRLAAVVAHGEMRGRVFCWDTMRWEKDRAG